MARTRLANNPLSSVPSLAAGTPLTGSAATLWASAILTAIGAPTTKANVGSMLAWFNHEGGGGANNPMNTKAGLPGFMSARGVDGSIAANGGGSIPDYASPADGVYNTAATLVNSFPAVVQTLKTGQGLGNPSSTASYELSRWSGGGYSSLPPVNSTSTSPIGTKAVFSRPGGAGASSSTTYATPAGPTITSAYADYSDTPVDTTDDVSFGGGLLSGILAPLKFALGQEEDAWKEFHGLVIGPADDVVKGADAIEAVAQETVRILENLPWYTVRLVEFTSGFALMGLGIYLSIGSGSGPAQAARTVILGSPIGKAKYLRAGRVEGRAEHYRLQGRQQERGRLSAREARKTQKAGTASRAARLANE